MTADARTSTFTAAAALTGDEKVAVLQSGADRLSTTSEIGDLFGVTDHINETDPYVHSAVKVSYDGTVSAADVQGAIDALNSGKASATPVSESGTTVNKNTTTAEENLISFTLPGGTLSSDGGMVVIEASGDILANSGSPTFTWKFKNGTVTLDTPATAMTTSANMRRWKLRAAIRRTTANSQSVGAILSISQAIATTSWNLADSAHSWVGNVSDIAATNFTSDSTVAFTVTMSVSNASDRVRMYGYTAYKVPA